MYRNPRLIARTSNLRDEYTQAPLAMLENAYADEVSGDARLEADTSNTVGCDVMSRGRKVLRENYRRWW
jgi:hypothetical protein